MHFRAWILLLAVLVGNCGFWLYCFNRINATGLPRRATKSLEKCILVACFLLPLVVVWWDRGPLWHWLTDAQMGWLPRGTLFPAYAIACWASLCVLGGWWLESRLWLLPPKHLRDVSSESHHVDSRIEGGTAEDGMTRFLCQLPGSDVGFLEVNRKHLRLPRSINGIESFSIGHLSDLHFTGQYRQAHYQFVFDRLMELAPDLIVISGDIIDYDRCLPWIEPLLGNLSAPLGTYFVLGNHDCRVSDLPRLVGQLEGLGFVDLGRGAAQTALASGTRLELIGNESPWLNRQPSVPGFRSTQDSPEVLKVAVSHSPDQISWARRCKADLMLAGHTHGGQVRFPCIGPIVAPSNYGSRFASGVFFWQPTLMHVSRGIAGTHPLRWRCKPEVSLLTFESS